MMLITGGPGQDAITLGALAISGGYEVCIAAKNPASLDAGIALLPEARWKLLDLLDEDMCQSTITEIAPTTVFNFAGKSSVSSSWEAPLDALDVNVKGTVNLLWATLKRAPSARFWQAGSSEMFSRGIRVVAPGSPMNAASPYGETKLQAGAWVRFFREHYGLDAASLIMFNHESPLRSREFVWKHIQAQFHNAKDSHVTVKLRNPIAAKDWGWATDFMEAALMTSGMRQGGDLILATGLLTPLRDIVGEFARAYEVSSFTISNDGPSRLNDDQHPVGDIAATTSTLGWAPKTGLPQAVDEMVAFADFSLDGPTNQRTRRAWVKDLIYRKGLG